MIAEKDDIQEIITDGVSAVKISNLKHFLVHQVFDCGQCFRFDPVSTSDHLCVFEGVAHKKYVRFIQDEPSKLTIVGATRKDYDEIWEHYLGLDLDYDAIDADILSRSDAPVLPAAAFRGMGIRILRQDPWETLISFIISQNNNIPRIKKIIRALCESLGEDLGNGYFSFPTPEAIVKAGYDHIFALKTGFRAKYILDAAEKVVSGEIDLDMIASLPYEAAKEKLCSIKGVGPKVASCVLLFGFAFYEAFPIDVWVKRILAKYFSKDFDPATLGEYAGIAQQYLFYFERYFGGEE